MNISNTLPTIHALKDQAKRLRQSLEQTGTTVTHSRSLELLAAQLGFKDWNTLHAAAGNGPGGPPVTVDQRVSGHYLGHPFQATVLGVRTQHPGNRYRVVFRFDNPVDVVRFEGMSALRQRVTAVIGDDGKTVEKTSDGQPHLRLDQVAGVMA